MKHPSLRLSIRRVLSPAIFVAGSLALSSALPAQDIAADFQRAVVQMQSKDWAAAKAALDALIAQYDGDGIDASAEFGPRFGAIYYHRGLCSFELKDYPAAIADFDICATKFANKKGTEPTDQNTYAKQAIFRKGGALQYDGKYEAAIEAYEKFIASKPEEGSYSKGAYLLSLGTCQAKIGKNAEAGKTLGTLFQNAQAYGMKPRQLLFAFRQLADGWIGSGKASEKDAHAFLDQYGSLLKESPWQIASSRSDVAMLQLGKAANDAGMFTLGIRILGFVPKTSDVVSELEQRAARYPKVPVQLQTEIDKYTALASGDPNEVRSLSQIATAYEKLGDPRAGYVIYDFLFRNYPNTTYRPQILYGAAAMASKVGDLAATQVYGETFLTEYPEHELSKDISALMLGQLFKDRKYEAALSLAETVRATMPEASPQRELPDFVMAGSFYYLGRYPAAEKEFADHVKNYPKSEFGESIRYFQAANLVKLGRWNDAASKLDAFLKDYPKSIYTDTALYERATTHFYGGGDTELSSALAKLDRVASEFPDSQVIDSAQLLRGDILLRQEKPAEATKAYQEAMATAEKMNHSPVEAAALAQLVAVSAQEGDDDKTIEYFERFEKDYSSSPQRAITLVTALPALKKAGRAEEGLSKMEDLIKNLGSMPDSEEMEKVVNTYAQEYMEVKSADALIDRIRELEKDVLGNTPLVAWLTMARIRVLEDPANKEAFKQREARIKVAYNDIQTLPKNQLANSIKDQVGRNLVRQGNIELARPWFQAVIDGNLVDYKDSAVLGLANADAASGKKADLEKAAAGYRRVIREFKTPALQEEATLGLGRVLSEAGDYKKALEEGWEPYVKNRSWALARAEANFRKSEAQDKLGQTDAALTGYMVGVVGAFKSTIRYSAPAWLRAAELEYGKGNKENAYKILDDMVTRMGHLVGNEQDESDSIRKAITTRDNWAAELGKTTTAPAGS